MESIDLKYSSKWGVTLKIYFDFFVTPALLRANVGPAVGRLGLLVSLINIVTLLSLAPLRHAE